jgi:hypothetical protein
VGGRNTNATPAQSPARWQKFFMRILYLNILLAISINSFSQVTFEERKADISDNKFDSILIIGDGSSVARVFLESVSAYIIKGCAKKNVTVNYTYVGNSLTDTKIDYDSIQKLGYKAILFLTPRNSANYESQTNTTQNTINTSAGTFATTRTKMSLTYSQRFNFQLCTNLKNITKIWIAAVGVVIDPSKNKIAKKVAKNVLSSFKKYNYIQ